MEKIILIPDSFKGTLSSAQVCEIVGRKVNEHFPACRVISIPVADGGEGSVDCFLTALGGEKVRAAVKGPFFEDMDAFYGLLGDGRTAVIEMAACAGLPLVEDRRDPCRTTTYGVGQLILAAAERGAKKIVVGLGGSATNDGGCGAAAVVGVKFLNGSGTPFLPTGGTLHEISRIDAAGISPVLKGIEITAMCDIDHPMYGPGGAAHVFAPQKGADPETVLLLDGALRHLAEVIRTDLGLDLSDLPGAGAAGAMGAGMVAFFGARLRMGIDTVLDTVRFDEVLAGADMVFTGEGRLDDQSLRGKVISGVARRARALDVPVIALVGGAERETGAVYDMGVTAVFSINRLPEDFSVSRRKSAENLALTADNVMRLIKAMAAASP